MTTTTRIQDPFPNVPLPAGATPDIWEGEPTAPSRVLHGASRALTGRDDVLVGVTAIQFPDGRLDTDGRAEPPYVFVETNSDAPLTRDQALDLAQALVAAVAELHHWTQP